jgi:cellulose synthase/poly-beta-1,6-N-acetylglucosamine synthase-like glycosyltransferase
MFHRSAIQYVYDNDRKKRSPYRALLHTFPIRYHLCALILGCVLLNQIELIQALEGQSLVLMINFVQMPAFYSEGSLFVGDESPPSRINLSIATYAQILFLMFFSTVAVISRSSIETRLRISFFGLVCFFVFILSQFLTIIIIHSLGIIVSDASITPVSVFLIAMSGSLLLEASLFSAFTFPKGKKIIPIIRRRLTKEYFCFILLLSFSFLFLYFILNSIGLVMVSPVMVPAILTINITTMLIFSYFLSYFIHLVNVPNWRKLNDDQKCNFSVLRSAQQCNAMRISFLIAAYNEEKIIGRCIQSIDHACAKYPGRAEIIVVNDGSRDNTLKKVTGALANLRHSSGQLFNIPNSGKGHALNYGLAKTTGEIIFRIDADSIIDENAIGPVMNHFKDPQVGSVSGMIFALERKTVWQSAINLLVIMFMYVMRRGQELIDSILIQSGAYSVFRKDALLKSGKWADDQFGEDGEITNRMARFGYKLEFEPESFIYTDWPETLSGLIAQRTRWAVAFYFARARNLELVRTEVHFPRSFIFLTNLMAHGNSIAHSLMWSYFAAAIITGNLNFSIFDITAYYGIPVRLALSVLLLFAIEFAFFAYFLSKFKMLGQIRYMPIKWVITIIVGSWIRPIAMETLLRWSSKWKEYDKKAYEALRQEVKKSIDPQL